MLEQKITIGRTVEFFPGKKEVSNVELPNGMESAPAIVVQVFAPHVNLNVFTASTTGQPVLQAWSIPHKNSPHATKDGAYWDWFARV